MDLFGLGNTEKTKEKKSITNCEEIRKGNMCIK